MFLLPTKKKVYSFEMKFMIKDLLNIKKIVAILGFVLINIALINCSSTIAGKKDIEETNNQPENHSPSVNETSNQNNNTEMPTVDLSKIPTVTYCKLVNNAFDFDHKIVRVRAVYGNEFERSFLYDSNCKKDSPPVAPEKVPAETWAEWDESFVSKGDSDEAILNRKINGFGRKDVTLIGKFDSTREKNDPSATNLFGHLACCRFQFLIMRVEIFHSIIGKSAESSNKFGDRIKFKVNQKLDFPGFMLECLELSKLENTFKVKENDKEMTISANNEMPTKFTFNGVNYQLELGVADKSGRIANDELIVSKIGN